MGILDVTEVLTTIIEVLMIFINVLPIYVISFYKLPRDKTTIDEVIFILSCGTVSLILFSMPFALIPYSNEASEVFALTCNMYQCAVVWFQVFSAFLISVMSVFVTYQGFHIVKREPSYQNRKWNRKVTSVIVGLICLACFGISFTPLIFSRISSNYVYINGSMEELNTTTSCHIYPEIKSVVTNLNTIALYVYLTIGLLNFTCVMMCLCMTSQLRRKIKVQMFLRVSNNEDDLLVDSDFMVLSYLGSSRLVQTVTALFYFFWIPNMVMLFLVLAGISISDRAIVYAMLGTIMTGLINPLVYAFFDKSYRRGYSRALRKLCTICRCTKRSNIVIETPMVTAVPEVSIDKPRDQYYTNEQCLVDGDFDDTETYEIMNNTYDSDVDNTDDDVDDEDMQHDCGGIVNNAADFGEGSYQNGSDVTMQQSRDRDRSPLSETASVKQMVVYLSGSGCHEEDKLLEEEDLMLEMDDPSTGL